MPTSHIVIPARLNSTRLPRKMLLNATGKSLLQHTYEGASRAEKPSGMTVATDSLEITAEVARFGGDYQMTSEDCASGTDRVAEVARVMPEVDIFVNVQGDEPEMAGEVGLPPLLPDACSFNLASHSAHPWTGVGITATAS